MKKRSLKTGVQAGAALRFKKSPIKLGEKAAKRLDIGNSLFKNNQKPAL
jgi:hypothetical protein